MPAFARATVARIKVYRFKRYDVQTDTMQESSIWGTRATIDAIWGEILEETGIEVDEATVSHRGFYVPK
jgi:hypothetical protein